MDVAPPRSRARAEINVTPLIDVVLVMLIAFMVLAPAARKHLPATIPRTAAAAGAATTPIVVDYAADRRLTVDAQVVAVDQLAARVAQRLGYVREKVVFFRVDDGCDYGDVVKLMDTVRGAGAQTLGIVTKH